MSPFPLIERVQRQYWAEQSDAELLQAFTVQGEQDAFDAIVERYGSLVTSICRRQLNDSHAADDAMQTTFLALFHKASTVHAQSLGAWLVRVAQRVCRKARLSESRRKERETITASSGTKTHRTDEVSIAELMVILDEELLNLSQRYRSALLACYWQGLSQADAARRLGLTPGALKGLLERGRAKLLKRLSRRGVTADIALRGLLVAPLALPPLSSNAIAQMTEKLKSPLTPNLVMSFPTMSLFRWGIGISATVALSIGLILVSSAMPQKSDKEIPKRNDPQPMARLDLVGDPLPDGALLRLGTTRFRHPDAAHALALSPNGKTIVTIGGNKIIAWVAETGKELWRESELSNFTASGTFAGTHELIFTPDGKKLITPGRGTNFALWDVSTGKHQLIDLKDPSGPLQLNNLRAIDISPDGKSLAIGSADGVFLSDLEGNVTRRILNTLGGQRDPNDRLLFHGHYSLGRFSPDGKTLAINTSDSSKVLRLHDTKTGEERVQMELQGYLVQMAFSPDSKQVAITERDHAVRVYDTSTGKRLHSWVVKLNNPYENYTSAVTFSPDGKLVAAAATDYLIRLWDTTSGKEVGQLKGTGWNPWGLAFTRDSKTLFSTGWEGVIRRWDVAKREQMPLPDGVVRGSDIVAASSNGQLLAYADDLSGIRIVDAKTGKELKHLLTEKCGPTRIVFSPDGKQLAVGGSHGDQVQVILWDLTEGKVKRRWDWAKGRDPHSHVEEIAFSPNGKQIAVAIFRRSESRIFEVEGEKNQTLKHSAIYSLDFSPDGTTLATAGWDKVIRLWNPETGKLQKEHTVAGPNFQDPRMYGIRFSPDGKWFATAMMTPEVFIWDAKTLTLKHRFDAQGSFIFNAMAFSPDGLRLATGNSGGRVRVWDPQTGKQLWDRGQHDGHMYFVGFGRDSRTLLAGGNGLGYLWDMRPKEPTKKALPDLWDDLIGIDSVAWNRAFWALLEKPEETVQFIAKKVIPKKIEPVDDKQIEQWIAELDSERFAVREAAQSELAKLGPSAASYLKKALKDSTTPEQRERLTKLLEKLNDDDFTLLRNRRIVSVLQHLETSLAKELLGQWAKLDSGSLGELAGVALKKMEK